MEYLNTIKYYLKYGVVYFLENSGYKFCDDNEFNTLKNLNIREIPKSNFYLKGKGFQEFEMLDYWISHEKNIPRKWFKITGRYIYQNIEKLCYDCINSFDVTMIIDLYKKNKKANTAIFYIDTQFYCDYILGLYLDCDDETNKSIEVIMFNLLKKLKNSNTRMFYLEPDVKATSGSTGKKIRNNIFLNYIKNILRKINQLVSSKYILY